MIQAFSKQTYAEGWDEEDLWSKKKPLRKIFAHYLPVEFCEPSNNKKKLTKQCVEVVGFVMCQGKPSDKIDVLFEMLVPPEECCPDNIDELSLDNPNFHTVIGSILEFCLIQKELFSYKIEPNSKQFRDAVRD